MIDPSVIDAMVAAGASAEVIAAAVKADHLIEANKLIEKRAKAAARKRRSRDVTRGHAVSQSVTPCPCDPPSPLSPPSMVSPITPSLTTPSILPSTKNTAPRRGDRYSEDFENRFWKPYPRTPVMSKAEAWKVWQRSGEDERAKIIAAVPRYAAWLKAKPDHPAVHACRFISQSRFEGFGSEEPPKSDAAWQPGLPTTEEILARIEKEKANANKGPAVDDGGTGVEQGSPGLVRRTSGEPGGDAMANLFPAPRIRAMGVSPADQPRNCGMDGAMPLARMVSG